MSDHHENADPSKRYGYKFSLGRSLAEDNAGKMYFWQPAYKEMHLDVWRQVHRLVKPGGIAMLNGSDFVRTVSKQKGGVITKRKVWYQVVNWHRNIFEAMGWVMEQFIPVETKRMKNGANRDERVPFEVVLVIRKLPPILEVRP